MRRRRRLSRQAVEVLAIMQHDLDAQHYGLELADEIGSPPGSIYPILTRFEQQGLLASELEDIDPAVEGRPRRRYYRLTGEGVRVARAEIAQLQQRLGLLSPQPGGATA